MSFAPVISFALRPDFRFQCGSVIGDYAPREQSHLANPFFVFRLHQNRGAAARAVTAARELAEEDPLARLSLGKN